MSIWENNLVQFQRLLCEIKATQELDLSTLSESMDLSVEEVSEVFDRATVAWEQTKLQSLNQLSKDTPIGCAIAALDLARNCGGELDIASYEESFAMLVTMKEKILKYDRQMNAAERSPTGDDYNELLSMLDLVEVSQE